MFKGLYHLTSGMMSQNHRLDTIANNMINISTAGFRTDQYIDTTFHDYVLSRVGNKDKENTVPIGGMSYLLAPSDMYTNHSQGALEPTNMPLNFAIEGDAFFAIQNPEGTITYTRCGDFSLDNEGYLVLPDEGRVLDNQGQPFLIGTYQIKCDVQGNLVTEDGSQQLGTLGLYRFPDPNALGKNRRGHFIVPPAEAGEVAMQPELVDDIKIHWKTLERSNVDLIEQMTLMMTAQRGIQSAAQLTKMYDEIMGQASSDIGRV